jgi:hypothetical protein
MGGKKETKAIYFEKLESLLKEYKSIFIVTVDNVSSQQMHEIRHSLRGEGVVLMGKNTMVRRALKGLVGDSPEYERLLPHVRGAFAASRSCYASPNTRRQRWLRLHQRRPQGDPRQDPFQPCRRARSCRCRRARRCLRAGW